MGESLNCFEHTISRNLDFEDAAIKGTKGSEETCHWKGREGALLYSGRNLNIALGYMESMIYVE